MPLPTDIRLYDDIRPHLDRAVESRAGIRITCATKGQAINLRQRLQKLRQLEKARSVDLYEQGDDRRAVTPWDNLHMTVKDNALLLEHRQPISVEDL